MNIHKVTTSSIVKPRDLIMISKVTLPKYDVVNNERGDNTCITDHNIDMSDNTDVHVTKQSTYEHDLAGTNTMLSQVGKSKGIRLAHINLRSLPQKLDQLRCLLHDKPIDILSVNETFLTSDITDDDLCIPGYCIYRKDRGSRHGGGVALYINDNFNCIPLNSNDIPNADRVECLWLQITRNKRKPVVVGTMYRPPNSNQQYSEDILDILEYVTNVHDSVIVMGDLNYNCMLRSDDDAYDSNISVIEQLTGLTQLVEEPTRVTLSSSSLIDVILTSHPDQHARTGVIPLALSDHYMPYTVIDGVRPHTTKAHVIRFRDYKRFDTNDFIRELYQTLPRVHQEMTDGQLTISEAWSLWRSTFDNICSKHAPLKTVRVKDRHNPWMTNELLQLMYERDCLHRKATANKNSDIWEQYKQSRNRVVYAIKQAQKTYYQDRVASQHGNKSAMWSSLKPIMGTSKSDCPIPITPQVFNDYFTTVGVKLAENLDDTTHTWNLPRSIYDFTLTHTDANLVHKLLRSFKEKSSMDILDMDSKLMRIGASAIAPSLTTLINISIQYGELPDEWKYARVTPYTRVKAQLTYVETIVLYLSQAMSPR